MLKAFDCFNVLGHLDYIVRYGPYEDKTVDHQKYQDIIDEIFKTLIQKGKGIEVNTSGYRDLKTCGFPNFEQVQRYYDLGDVLLPLVLIVIQVIVLVKLFKCSKKISGNWF